MGSPYDNQDNTLNITKKMDISQRIQDVAMKLCAEDGARWTTSIDPNKPGGLSDEELKIITIEQEEIEANKVDYLEEATNLYNRLSSIGYTITTK